MAYNIGSNPTALTAPATGDKVAIHDVSAYAEKYITRGHLVGPTVENHNITTAAPNYQVVEDSGADVRLFVEETNDTAHTITFTTTAANLRDGQKITIVYLLASTANATFAKGGAGAISDAHGAAVSQYQVFEYYYSATDDKWIGAAPALVSP
jgi:hypothetical protein